MGKSPIQTRPLNQLSLEQAIQLQFKIIDTIPKYFDGKELVQAGDFGHPIFMYMKNGEPTRGWSHPDFTVKVERILADVFGAKEATLVWGGGSGAFHRTFMGALNTGDKIVLDDTYPYPTVFPPLRAIGAELMKVDMDNLSEVRKTITKDVKAVWITHCNELKNYYASEVIDAVRSTGHDPLIMVDDNYVACRVEKIGVQLGSDISVFSLYKLLGIENIGAILGAEGKGEKIIEQIRLDDVSSAGLMVQGPAALRALKQIIFAPVMLAIHKQVVDETVERLNNGEVDGIDYAVTFSAPSLTPWIKLNEPIADKVCEVAYKYGSTDRPIGAESVHELTFRISHRSFLPPPKIADAFPADSCVTLRPYRAGPNTCINALRKCIQEAKKK